MRFHNIRLEKARVKIEVVSNKIYGNHLGLRIKIVLGIIDRHLEPEQREILSNSDDTLRMYEDLGVEDTFEALGFLREEQKANATTSD